MATETSQTVASTGLGIRFIRNGYWGAWSGKVVTNNTTVTALDFDSPDVPLNALFSWVTDFAQIGSGHEYRLIITLNEEDVVRFNSKNEAGRAAADWDPIRLIIPAHSAVKVTVFCETTSDIKWTINLVSQEI